MRVSERVPGKSHFPTNGSVCNTEKWIDHRWLNLALNIWRIDAVRRKDVVSVSLMALKAGSGQSDGAKDL
jgi:hypothetical protein